MTLTPASSLLLAATAAPPDRVIIISRHGVRQQFPSSVFNFSLYAPTRKFETSKVAWGVEEGMGVLTRHGYEAVSLMGAYQRQRYASLLSGCEAFVYCEEDMARDEKTAEAFFSGLGCALPPLHSEGVEYLIDQGSKARGDHGECALGTRAQVEGRVGGSVDEYLRIYRPLIRKMGELLGCCDASLCEGQPAGSECRLEDLPSGWDPNPKHWYTTFLGPLCARRLALLPCFSHAGDVRLHHCLTPRYAGKYFGEWIELTMLNGMDFAWGERSVEEVMELSAFVTQYRAFEFDLLAAQPFGSTLLAHLAALLLVGTGPPPCSRTAPHPPPWAIWTLGARPRAPERRMASPPPPAPETSVFSCDGVPFRRQASLQQWADGADHAAVAHGASERLVYYVTRIRGARTPDASAVERVSLGPLQPLTRLLTRSGLTRGAGGARHQPALPRRAARAQVARQGLAAQPHAPVRRGEEA